MMFANRLHWLRIGLPVLVVLLLCSHWGSYRLGFSRVQDKKQFLQELSVDCDAQLFEWHLRYLRILARFPDKTSASERLHYCHDTEALADKVEHSVLARGAHAGG